MITEELPKVLSFSTKSSNLVEKSRVSGPPVPKLNPPVRKLNFTKKALDALPASPPDVVRTYYHDTKVRGLTIGISPTKRKIFVLYRKINGRPERITIGLYPDLTIEQARGRAEEMNSTIANGHNPAQQRRTIRAEDTLSTLWAKYYEECAKHTRTADKIQGMYRLYLSSLRFRKLSSITHSDVVRLHTHIGKTRGKIVANRGIELLSSMFTQAKERWNWKGENPAANVEAFPEKKRKRFLQPDELPRFFKALAEERNEIIRDYILMSLVTGARRGNVQAMRWDEINFERAVWEIPRTKNEEPLTVPLIPEALDILERRKAFPGDWVFPSHSHSASGHLEEPKAAWKRILERAGIADLRLHDLRRTLGSWQACAGTSLPIIGESLGHKSLAATQIYARLNLDPVRASMTKAGAAMWAAGNAGLLTEGKPEVLPPAESGRGAGEKK